MFVFFKKENRVFSQGSKVSQERGKIKPVHFYSLGVFFCLFFKVYVCVLERGIKTGLWGDRSYKTKEKLCLCLFLEVRKKSKVMKRGIQER